MHSAKKTHTALLIIDVQNDVVARAYDRVQVIKNINSLVARARTEDIPIIWVQHSSQEMPSGSEGWKIVPDLQPQSGELKIYKIHGDAFEATDLKIKLDEMKINRLIVAGAQTEACIRSTIHGAFTRGYDTVLVSDAHTTEDLTSYGLPPPEKLIHFTNIYWGFQTGSGRVATVEKSADVRMEIAEATSRPKN